MSTPFRLALYPWQSRDLLHDAVYQCQESVDTPNLGVLIAECWSDGEATLHVHADVRFRGEAVAHNLCWLFERSEPQSGKPLCDWLDIDWLPGDSSGKGALNRQWQAEKQSAVFVDVRHPCQLSELVLPWRISVGLSAIPRLRLLNDCPCIPVYGYAVQGTPFDVLLRRSDALAELFLGRDERELMGLLWFLALPKDELPNEVVKRGPEIVQEVAYDQRPLRREMREWINRYNMPCAIALELDMLGIGMLFAESAEFILERAQVYLCPAEFGAHTRHVSHETRHGITSLASQSATGSNEP